MVSLRRVGITAGVGRQAMQKQGQARIKKREKMARKKGGWGGGGGASGGVGVGVAK